MAELNLMAGGAATPSKKELTRKSKCQSLSITERMKARLLLLMGQDGDVTDEKVRQASAMTKLRMAETVKLMRNVWRHGVHSHKVRTRGENGVFVTDNDAPETPTACINEPESGAIRITKTDINRYIYKSPNGGRRKGVAKKKKVIEMRSERLITSSTPGQMSGCIPTAQPAASGMGYLTPPPLWAYSWPSGAQPPGRVDLVI